MGMPLPERKTSNLRHARISQAGGRYFLTICTRNRDPVLTAPVNAKRISGVFTILQSAGDIDLHAATIMPDHLHLLFTLGTGLTLGQSMAKLKNLARDFGRVPWRWLEDGFEHRLRPHELTEDYGFYIFMNPYRARLLPTNESWPWWYCPRLQMFRFPEHFSSHATPPEAWLDTVEETSKHIVTGE